ncbi:hypothetical protein N8I74_15335 [Chitiniphilus purpureus]|uniref:Exonuclease SbcC n=1 Tax=Chitiniphilus purpureus TaxID=2981137 RepID=A0ABY6DJZ1_9NEIS|nr:hypothetical protein [Chitiniphilus sp. CD1]UXY14677.1 hypothetical protein N8I74_15335 [Chitiniphilus sp. CD1]
MADPTTLVELAQRERDAAQAALPRAAQDFESARQADKAAREDFVAVSAALAAAGATVARLRRQLAAAPLPADAAPLLAALAEALLAERGLQAARLHAELARTLAVQALEDAALALEGARTAQATAEAAWREEEARAARWTQAETILTVGPAAPVRTTAAEALAGAVCTAVGDRVAQVLPEALRNRARARYDAAPGVAERALQAAQALATALDAELQASGLASDTLPALERTLALREAALLSYAEHAVAEVAGAVATLLRLAQEARPQLTDEQQAELDDAAQLAARTAAAAAQHARDTAALTLAQKGSALRIARLQALAQDPDADLAALEADAGTPLGEAAQALQQAQDALDIAEATYAGSTHPATLSAWEAAVPDSAWIDVAAFFQARETLERYAALDAATLAPAVTAAAAAVLAARIQARARRRRLAWLAATLPSVTAQAGDIATFTETRRLYALRGQPTF